MKLFRNVKIKDPDRAFWDAQGGSFIKEPTIRFRKQDLR